MEIKPIARIYTGFPEKFGVPRQSGIVSNLAVIIPEREYARPEAFRGLESYSHLWLVWEFTQSSDKQWTPTVRPPRLGGNKRVGVFATRSPFRPNSLGLSSVKLREIDLEGENGPVLYVEGADIIDGTPIYDIKPYLAYTDSHPDAICGFADERLDYSLEVHIPDEFADITDNDTMNNLIKVLSHDPRPAYQDNPDRIYKMSCLGMNVEFTVKDNILTVICIVR